MSRINCNVTKDLLASYLDKICSEESKGLVEEHLQSCPSCRQFLKQLQEQDLGRDAQKADHLKKLRRYMDIRSVLGVIVLLVLLSIGVFLTGYYEVSQTFYYYIAMPVMMLTCALVLEEDRERAQPVGLEWLFPVLGLAVVAAAIFLQCRTVQLLEAAELSRIPMERMQELGPYFYRLAQLTALAASALLVIQIVYAKRKRCVFLISQNLAWLGMNLALSFGGFLRSMVTPQEAAGILFRSAVILTGEFAAVTALIFLLRRLFKKLWE